LTLSYPDFIKYIAQTSEEPLGIEVNFAEGIYLHGPDNKRWIDFISGHAVSNAGHRHPEVIAAIQSQLEKYLHITVYGETIQGPQIALAKYLTSQLPANLNNVFYVNSGTEATEGAMKLARRVSNRTKFVSCKNSYHGSTMGALSLMGGEYFKQAYRPLLPETYLIAFNNIESLDVIDDKTAAVVIEMIQAESGSTPIEENFLKALIEKCRQHSVLIICDEIQTGAGRTGKPYAFMHFPYFVPDILLTAKGFGGGVPIGAFVADKKLMQTFTSNPVLGNINTYGGNALCCAAAFANLKIILDDKILLQIEFKEKLIREQLVHPMIKSIRGKGLMLSLEFGDVKLNKAIIRKCIENGLLTDWYLFSDTTLRIAPPLIITETEILESCKIILKSINEIQI
jgi:acetylornithine/succinyldiaminopimelate/putrescine aminotransferase